MDFPVGLWEYATQRKLLKMVPGDADVLQNADQHTNF
jgi:hypothetical protein